MQNNKLIGKNFINRVWKTSVLLGVKFSLKFRLMLKEVNNKRHIQGKRQDTSTDCSSKIVQNHLLIYIFLNTDPSPLF